jgi:hypothetical protein
MFGMKAVWNSECWQVYAYSDKDDAPSFASTRTGHETHDGLAVA